MNTKFFTGMGDDGLVKFGTQTKKKSDQCFHALGLCDEVNVLVGFAKVSARDEVAQHLLRIQECLFILQAELASIIFSAQKTVTITKSHIDDLEKIILFCDEQLEPITSFIIPGGEESALRLEIARVRARAFERALIMLEGQYEISDDMKQFSNRLSSVFFALARYENKMNGFNEISPKYK